MSAEKPTPERIVVDDRSRRDPHGVYLKERIAEAGRVLVAAGGNT
jgi:hypothetical protein